MVDDEMTRLARALALLPAKLAKRVDEVPVPGADLVCLTTDVEEAQEVVAMTESPEGQLALDASDLKMGMVLAKKVELEVLISQLQD